MKVPYEGRVQYGVILALLTAIFTGAVVWGATQNQLADTRVRVQSLETQQQSTHDTLIEVRQDVKWIRERLK